MTATGDQTPPETLTALAGADLTDDKHPGAGDVVEFQFSELANREQGAPLPLPVPNPALLPFHLLDPEVFERVVAEIVFRHRDNLAVHFYGRRGQEQYGLDIVERMNDGNVALYQVKRYQDVRPAQLRGAVLEYAGPSRVPTHDLPQRRFNPQRFVVVTSAGVDRDTANVDEVARLFDEYDGDLAIQVWGAEELSRSLRQAHHLVAAVFGPAWAEAFCGYLPPAATPQDPRPSGLIEEPAQVLGLATMVADAQAREAADPTAAAALYERVADELDKASFPGHAALMRTRQASAARAAGDRQTAFDIEFGITLARVTQGDNVDMPPEVELGRVADELGGAALAKWQILQVAAAWPERGSDLAATVDAVGELAGCRDVLAAQLGCLVLEQALVDGLFDFDPPRSMFVDADANTAPALASLRDAVASLDSPDLVLRARLRCAVADTALRVDSTSNDVAAVYEPLVEDALDGRLLLAGGLVLSRAAYAFATHGNIDRAESMWRRSVLASSQDRLYGDARNALRAIHSSRTDIGQWPANGLSTVVQAMPNRRRLIEARQDVSLGAFEAAQEARLPDAFGDTRRWLWEARLSGHLVEERLAWRLLGRVLTDGGHPAGAAECFVLAGEAADAVAVVRPLSSAADTWRWTVSPVRRRRAAAVQVGMAQDRLVADHDLPGYVDDLIALTDGLWQSPWMGPNPQLDAVKAIAALGVRIPEAAVEPILGLAQPALERPTRASAEVANLIVQAYWAREERRDELAAAIAAMLHQAEPPHNLWGLVESIPSTARDPLLPNVVKLAGAGNRAAATALAAWRFDTDGLQLEARRACAWLLRRPVGHDRDSHSLGTSEEQVATLLLALLDAEDEKSVPPENLVPNLCGPVGGVIMTSSVIPADSPVSSDRPAVDDVSEVGWPDSDEPGTPDEAAYTAAGARQQLLASVADKLLALAEDTKDIAGSRHRALLAWRGLLPRLPGNAAAGAAERLLGIHDTPGLSAIDLHEVETDTPLSRARINTGASSLAAGALLAAAEAVQRAGADGDILVDHPHLASRLIAAALPLLQEDAAGTNFGAAVIAAVACTTAGFAHYATALLFHPKASVRAVGAANAPIEEHLFAQLAVDPAASVRVAVAGRGTELPVALYSTLATDPDSGVRHALRHARARGQTGITRGAPA